MAPAPRLAVEYRPLAEVRVDPGNPHTHPDDQVAGIARSIEAFGFDNPILVGPDGVIIAGEARRLAAERLGLAEAPVIVLGHLTPAQRQAFRIADNKLADGAGWDEALLVGVLQDLDAQDFDLSLTGFSNAELDELLARPLTDDEAGRLDAAPTLPSAPVSQLGDLWQLGDHRVVCGDSTDAPTIARLVSADDVAAAWWDLVFTDPPYGMAYEGGRAKREAPQVVFTDPPYGMSFGAGKDAGSTAKGALVKAHGQILGDDVRGDALTSLVGTALQRAAEVARPGAAFYVCLTWRTYREFADALEACRLAIAACIVWDKGSIGLGHQHYRPRHEFIFYCRGETWLGGKAEGDVWEFSRGRTEDYVHPTQKPVELVGRALGNSSRRGEVVLDLFSGSGSTLIACEVLDRRARLVELDPKYCDVIVQRWQSFTGRGGALAVDGRSFEEVASARRG